MAQKNKPWMASEIENLKTASLVPSARNARTHSAEQIEEIAGSIRRFGWTNPVLEGDAVYDPFMGSGTTLIAAAQNGRVAYGCEISPAYCDLIRRRWTRWADRQGIAPGSGAL